MVATPQDVQLFRTVFGDHLEPVDSMPMSRLVAHYGQQNERELYFEPYVRTMLELWLRDLTIHWKKADEPPPSFGPKEFQAAVNTGTRPSNRDALPRNERPRRYRGRSTK